MSDNKRNRMTTKTKATKAETKPRQRSLKPKCPKCGCTDIDQIDNIQAKTPISRVKADGTVTFVGETDVQWDSQEAKTSDSGHRIWLCSSCGYCMMPNKFLPEDYTKVIKG
jgi:predicted RNA-binding Zn-ribbon protein involved in translation (DUF1610 family)